jgi:CRISPR-associated protein Cas2
MERSFFVVVYDVVDDKRRLKVSKALEALGERAQKSVFEVYLTAPELDKLLRKLEKAIDKKEDSLRVYDLCSACRAKVRSIGLGVPAKAPGVVIV